MTLMVLILSFLIFIKFVINNLDSNQETKNIMSTGVDLTVEDIVQKVLGSRLKVAAKDKELLEKQRKKVNKSTYLKQEKTLTQRQFIQNYELQDCNMKLQQRLGLLKKKYQKQMGNYKKTQNVNRQIEKVKQKLNQISMQNMKLQKQLDKVRIAKIKLTSRENTLNLCSASSQKSQNYTYRKGNSKSPIKNNHNYSLKGQRKNNQIHPFLINSQTAQANQVCISFENKNTQTDYILNKKQQVQLSKQLAQKKGHIQELNKIVQSQEAFIKTYELNGQQQNLRKKSFAQTKVKARNIQQSEGKIVSLTKKVDRNNVKQPNNNIGDLYNKNTVRQEVSEFFYQGEQRASSISPIAGTIIKVVKGG